jgi:hypothetical protein
MNVWLRCFCSMLVLCAAGAECIVNPFACKRPIVPKIAQNKDLEGLDVIGVVGGYGDWQVVIRRNNEVHTLRVGERIGDVVVQDVAATSVKIRCKGKELVLTFKDE